MFKRQLFIRLCLVGPQKCRNLSRVWNPVTRIEIQQLRDKKMQRSKHLALRSNSALPPAVQTGRVTLRVYTVSSQ